MEYLAGIVVICAVALAIYHNKKDQNGLLKYYKDQSEKGSEIYNQSIQNQEKMIELLTEISKKLDQ